MNCEQKGSAAVAWLKGTKHRFYEDRYRILSYDIPLIEKQRHGEIFAVFDGIGSAPRGMNSAQSACDQLLRFFRVTENFLPTAKGLEKLLQEINMTINGWGTMPGTDKPLGGCAGTVAWIHLNQLTVFHAGDTAALIIRDGEVRKLTSDHESNGAIYRYLGLGRNLVLEVATQAITEGDLLLLVSDGVTKAYHATEAAQFIADIYSETGEIAAAAQELAAQSRIKGSSDDITVLLI